LGDFLFISGTGEMKLDPGTREETGKGIPFTLFSLKGMGIT
jgi:hypothetical protein